MPPGLLNSIVKAILFPRPTPATYGPAEPLPDRLLYIPLVEPEAPHRESGNHTFAYLLHHAANTHLLIYAHPNAVDLGLVVGELEVVSQRAKVSVLLFEYSGYGLTDTDITERSINTDMLSAYYFARRHLMVPPEKMLVCGRSIGAAPAAHLCANLPTDASPALLILQCPFASLSDCIHELSGQALTPIANFLGYDLFRTIDLIADVRCPVALHHGTHDATIPIKSSYQLQQRRDEAERPCVTYLYPDHGQGHNNLRTSTLVDIIRERKDDGDLHELHLTWPAHLVAHPSVHPHLFSHRSGELIAGLSELAAAWRRRLHIRQYLFSRDNLHLLLTASVCWFSVHCTRAWQIYSRLHHENVCGEDGRRDRCTKQVFVRRCIACWGSPVGIGVPEPTSGNQVAAVVFGCAVAPHRIRYFDTSATFSSCHELPPLMPIYEMPVSDGLVHAIKRVITAAPSLIDDVDAQHLSAAPDLVDAIQGECERLVGFLPSERWEALQMLLANFETQSSDVVSARASSFLRSWRLQERDEAEHTDEDPCQLHSWGDVLQPDGDVPLDCRLYAARCLAHRLPLCPQMDWRECRRSIEEAGMAATIYERCQRAMMQPSVEAD